MASLQAEIVRRLLVFTGLKKFFSNAELFEKKLAKERHKGPDKPKKKFLKKYDLQETTQDGYKVFMISSKAGTTSNHHVLYLHGGGYVLDLAWAHWDFIGRLIEATGTTVTLPIYPLAPESKCAELTLAMQKLFGRIVDQHGAENITVMGDSAGAGMTLTLGQVLRDAGDTQAARLVLLSPWLDATASDPSQSEIEKRDVMLGVKGLEMCAEAYRGDLAVDHPWVSPLFGDMSDLPPVQIFAGTDDILLPDARRLSEKLKAKHIAHDYQEYADMYHVWMLISIPEGKRAMASIAEFMGEG